MNKEPEDTNEYDIFKANEDLATLEVTEETAPRKETPIPPAARRKLSRKKRRLMQALFASIVIIALILSNMALFKAGKKPAANITINTQSLDNGTLNQIAIDAGGASKQQLTITPDTLFQNSVTVNKDLTVKGQTFLQNPVSISKEVAIGGNVGVGGNLSVNGLISAGNLNVGSVTIGSLRLSGNLEFDGHFIALGARPTIKTSFAAGGGTATIDGTDTSGIVTINVGAGSAPGQMAIITFRTAFGSTPKVQLTPVSFDAAKLDYFVSRTAGFFAIEAASAPTAGKTYIFDYFVSQ